MSLLNTNPGDAVQLAIVRDMYNSHLCQYFENDEKADAAMQRMDWDEFYTRTRMAEKHRMEMLRLDEKRNQLSGVMEVLNKQDNERATYTID